MSQITFRKLKKYKYQLQKTFSLKINIYPASKISTDYIGLEKNGILTVYKGYAWDGPSGPAIDFKSYMRGSLVHDVLYQLMREKLIDYSNKEYADRLFEKMICEDGIFKSAAKVSYFALKIFGRQAIQNKKIKVNREYKAP